MNHANQWLTISAPCGGPAGGWRRSGGGAAVCPAAELPDTFVLEQGQPLAVESMPFLQAAPAVPAGSAAPAGVTAADKSANVTLTLLGLPVKTVRTVQQQRRTVRLGGTPFGVKMFTDGALVVAFSDIYTVHGSENPAKEAGLRLGDLITQQTASRCAPMRN